MKYLRIAALSGLVCLIVYSLYMIIEGWFHNWDVPRTGKEIYVTQVRYYIWLAMSLAYFYVIKKDNSLK